jgi:hypothetical protein
MSRIYPLPMLTPNDVESPTIEEMWLKFSQCIPPGTCPEHVREFRNAFYSGSLGLINEAMKLSRGDFYDVFDQMILWFEELSTYVDSLEQPKTT